MNTSNGTKIWIYAAYKNKTKQKKNKERRLYPHNSEVHCTPLLLKISTEHLRNVTYDLLNAISQTLSDYPLHSNDVWQSKLPAVKNITLCEYEWACERSCAPAARRSMTALFLVQTVAACHHSLLRSESKTCPFEFYIWSILSDCLSQRVSRFKDLKPYIFIRVTAVENKAPRTC